MALTRKSLPQGVWRELLVLALRLIDDAQKKSGRDFQWSFGGGTVLMLRYRHRRSKDVDIFVPDAQYLGFVTPRLSALAQTISEDYVETSEHVKLIRPEGEIDFVSAPSLTTDPIEIRKIARRAIRVETAVEIVAKKLWYRGDMANARDLFDLALVIEKEPRKLAKARPFLTRHRKSFLEQLRTREAILKMQFSQIDVMDYCPSFEMCTNTVTRFLEAL